MGGILDRECAVSGGDVHDGVHLTSDARVVHGDNRFRTRRDRVLDQRLVEVQGVRADLDEHGDGAAEHERVRGRDEGEGWHDHLVAWPHVHERRRQLERSGPECVSSAFAEPVRRSSHVLQRRVKGPLPARWPLAIASRIAANSAPVAYGLLKGMRSGVTSSGSRR